MGKTIRFLNPPLSPFEKGGCKGNCFPLFKGRFEVTPSKAGKTQKGFTLIELLVVIGILAIIIGIPYAFLTKELKHTVKESAFSQSALEKIPSVEILRKDIEDAGYGLVWDTGNVTYSEASSSTPSLYSFNQNIFNDAPNSPPRAVVSKVDITNSKFSYLVLKGTSLALNKACKHWSYINKNDDLNIWPTDNTANYNNFQKDDRVVVMDAGSRKIVQNIIDSTFYFEILKDAVPSDKDPSNYYIDNWDNATQSVYLIYGIDDKNLIAPFNRVDYRLYDGSDTKSECAKGTHTLGRAVMRQSDGVMYSYPLLHCVADFQVGFGLDTTKDGKIDIWTQDITTLTTAKDVRDQLKQVRVYILVQNGKKDKDYNYPHTSLTVGETINGTSVGRDFDLSTQIRDYQHYRWKLIKLVVEPKNLGVK
jgi:prepilin-type N-terminal cleavage/methylation domain-containing protein